MDRKLKDNKMVKLLLFLYELFELILYKVCILIIHVISLPIEIIMLLYDIIIKDKKRQIFSTILITGASSGIGRAFAVKYSKNGKGTILILIARNKQKLLDIQKICQNNGCKCVIYSCDVTNKDEMKSIIDECETKYNIDLIFANAGIRADVNDKIINTTYKTFDINLYGILNTILPIIPYFIKRNKGQIVINSSISALTPQYVFPMYSASKLALLGLSENLRTNLVDYNIGVSCILPGFVKTDLLDNLNKNKLKLIGCTNIDDAINNIINGIELNRYIISFGFISTLFGNIVYSLTPIIKQFVLDYHLIERAILWHNIVPKRQY